MNDAASRSVTFGWKYIPSAGGSGADVDCPTTSISSTQIARAWIGRGEVQYLLPRLEEAPMSFHIMEGLRALPAVGQLPAMLIEGTAEAVRAGGRRLPWSE